MNALQTRMSNWKADWNFMEQKEKDLYLQCEAELAAMQARIEKLEAVKRAARRLVIVQDVPYGNKCGSIEEGVEMTDVDKVIQFLRGKRAQSPEQIYQATHIKRYRLRIALAQLRELGLVYTELKPTSYLLIERG